MFSQGTFFILLFTLILVFLLPNLFIQQEAISLHFLIVSFSAFVFVFFYLLLVFRQRQFVLGSTPLLWPLIGLFISFFFVIIAKQPFPSFFHLISYAGFFLNFIVLSLIGNTLIKKNNGLLVINILIIFASATTLFSFFSLLTNIFPHQVSYLSFLPQPSFHLQLSLILLGLTSIFSLFFKKGKINHRSYLFLLPFLFLGLVATILSYFLFHSTSQAVISFSENIRLIFSSLITNQHFDFSRFFLGQPHQTFTDFYRQFATSNLVSSSTYLQSYNLPLLIQTQFGFLPVFAWFFFFFRLFQLTFLSQHKDYNYLFFILFVSCCLQLFTPFSPFIFLVQVLIITFASDKNRQLLIRFKSKAFAQKKNPALLSIILILFFFFNLSNFVYVSKSYFSYFLISQALSNPNLSLENFIQTTALAYKISPSLDYFSRLAAIGKLETTISLIKNDPQQEKLAQEQILAQESLTLINQALHLNPYNAINYRTKATLYQELAPYNPDNFNLFNQEITTAYSQAILLQPRNPDLYLELGNFYLLNSQTEIALNLTQEALKIKTDYLPAVYQLAQIYQLQQQTALAQSTYQHAKSLLDPQSSNYENNLQLIEQRLKQTF